MAACFELTKSDKGQYSFCLKAGNGEIVLRSEQYGSKASALNGIASVQTNSQIAGRFARAVAKDGRPYFNLKAGNHQIIGTSQMYKGDANCEAGIESVRTCGASKEVKDNT